MHKLTDPQLQVALDGLPKWKLQDGALRCEKSFIDFPAAIAFVNRVAEMAEAAGHHPDIDIRYNHVCLVLVTHDAGGITAKDVELATAINSAG